MGGSSVLNYMIYTRGHENDFNGWAKAGNDGKLQITSFFQHTRVKQNKQTIATIRCIRQ